MKKFIFLILFLLIIGVVSAGKNCEIQPANALLVNQTTNRDDPDRGTSVINFPNVDFLNRYFYQVTYTDNRIEYSNMTFCYKAKYHRFKFCNALFSNENTWVFGQWDRQTLDTIGEVGCFNSVAVFRDSCAQVSNYDSTNIDLKYGEYYCTTWNPETTAGIGNVGQNKPLTHDSEGCPYICYFDNTNKDLKHLRFGQSLIVAY